MLSARTRKLALTRGQVMVKAGDLSTARFRWLALLACALVVAASLSSSPAPGRASRVVSQTRRSSPAVPNRRLFGSLPTGKRLSRRRLGKYWSYAGLSDTTPTLVADLSTEVDDYWDQGLLGLALPPNFPTDNHLYVLYTYDAPIGDAAPTWNDVCPSPPGATTDGCVVSGRLSRLTISGGVSTGEQVLVNNWCQQFPTHSIGTVTFGNDG